jgi:hypothetical protein
MIALMLTAVGTLAVAQLIPRGLAVTVRARRQALALRAAQDKLEEVVARHYDDMVSEDMFPVGDQSAGELRLIRRSVEVTFVNPDKALKTEGKDHGLKRVRVIAEWREGEHTRQVTLMQLVPDRR